ncbi:MAG TPA: hypothetical protein VFA97_10560 [Gaiellaceae bacterium]|nr:hypothetical protein [Gaiellaceae bacterium]
MRSLADETTLELAADGLNDVRFGTPTLEDVFINLTGRSLR